MHRQIARIAAFGIGFLGLAGSAQAHHAMDGALPATFSQGLLSGLAHPVIGLDHLAFIAAAGLIAGIAGLGLALPLVFVLASVAGVFLHLQLVDLPAAELVIALSVVCAGLLLAAAPRSLGRGAAGTGLWAGLFAVAGLFHGYAYGEAIVGAESTPLWAYLAGLAVIQALIAVGVAALASGRSWSSAALAPRLAGAAAFGIGLTALVGQILPG